ncbi:MAG: SDR family NAD(P)-dependent oxidoreductase [Bdellovibrio sp.]|nr:SDR family NAD(P)-dependent oxidoreductase [Bdellovibrio sp.]
MITGAGSGVGRALAVKLAPHARALILLDISTEGLKATEQLINSAKNLRCHTLDVRSLEGLQQLAQSLASNDLPDIVIANAGLGGINPAYAWNAEIDRRFMEVNYFGTSNLVAVFAPIMAKRRSGHIVGVCSLAAMRGLPMAASYSASKAAQLTLLESIRNDLRPYGVFVSTFLPGFIKTPMADHNEFDRPFMITSEDCADEIIKGTARKVAQLMFPWPMRILGRINRLLPVLIYDFLIPRLSGARSSAPKTPKIFGNFTIPFGF